MMAGFNSAVGNVSLFESVTLFFDVLYVMTATQLPDEVEVRAAVAVAENSTLYAAETEIKS